MSHPLARLRRVTDGSAQSSRVRQNRAGQRAEQLQRMAAAQRGLLAVAQLDAMGMGKHARRAAVQAGRLGLVRRGVYQLPGTPELWENRALAAVIGAGGTVAGGDSGAVVSHFSAARLWQLIRPGSRWWSDCIELTGPRMARLEGVRSHVGVVGPVDRNTRRSVPVTSVARTLLDLAPRLDEAALAVLVDVALRGRLVDLGLIDWTIKAHRAPNGSCSPGSGSLERVVAARRRSPTPSANAWEAEMDRLWDRLGLPPAERQYWIVTPHGSYRPDRALVHQRIAVDWNGYRYHGSRSQFDFDSDRRGHLIEASWLPLDFTSNSTPEHICRTVLAASRQREYLLERTPRPRLQ